MKFIVIGSGVIVHKFVKAFRYAEKIMGNAEIVGVLDVNKEQASEFAKTYDIPNVFTNPDEINVEYDAVYLGVPNFLHYPLAMQYMKMGKHVLCEKPLADSYDKANELFKVAEENNVQLMEAYMHINHPLYRSYKGNVKQLKSNYYGQLPDVANGTADTSNINFFKREKFGGSVADVGVYPIALGIHLMGPVKDFEINIIKKRQNVETEFSLVMNHVNGGVTETYVSSEENKPEEIGVYLDGELITNSITFRNLQELRMSHEIMNFVYGVNLDENKKTTIEIARVVEKLMMQAHKQVDNMK